MQGLKGLKAAVIGFVNNCALSKSIWWFLVLGHFFLSVEDNRFVLESL